MIFDTTSSLEKKATHTMTHQSEKPREGQPQSVVFRKQHPKKYLNILQLKTLLKYTHIMVSSSSLQSLTTRPLILQHRRSSRFFLTSHHQWRQIQNLNDGDRSLGLSHLHNPNPPSLNPRLPLRLRLLLPRPPLHPLLRPRPPPRRHLTLSSSMTTTTTPAAAASHSSSDSSSATKTVRVVIKGRVQGVFYRNWTIDNANELGLKGWVRNRRDGSVEALFSGNPNSVDEMQQRCRRGPPAAVVTGLEVFPSSDDPGSGFDRKPTV